MIIKLSYLIKQPVIIIQKFINATKNNNYKHKKKSIQKHKFCIRKTKKRLLPANLKSNFHQNTIITFNLLEFHLEMAI